MPKDKRVEPKEIIGPTSTDKIFAKAKTSSERMKGFSGGKTISTIPEPSFGRKLLKNIVGFPYAHEIPTVSDVVSAGLPFGAFIPKIGRNFLLHGTGAAFEKFDPAKGNITDLLGHFQPHAAESAEYAASYLLKSSGKYSPRLIPIQPEAKNVLDLIEPNIDDLSQAIASLPEDKKSFLVKKYKSLRKIYDSREARKDLAFWLTRELNNPQSAKNLPFDAIRYNDLGAPDNPIKAWAFPHSTPLKTPWGVPLTESSKELKLFKHNKITGAQAELARSQIGK